MKKFIAISVCAALLMSFVGCGSSETSEPDTSELTGIEAVSDDGSVSILLPDETFAMTSSSDTTMDFESEEGYISVIKADEDAENSIYDIVPTTEDEVIELFGVVDAEVEVRNFVYDEKDGTKYYSAAVVFNDYKEDEDSEPENFIILENLTTDGTTYYYATAEIQDEDLIDAVAASLATFGEVTE